MCIVTYLKTALLVLKITTFCIVNQLSEKDLVITLVEEIIITGYILRRWRFEIDSRRSEIGTQNRATSTKTTQPLKFIH